MSRFKVGDKVKVIPELNVSGLWKTGVTVSKINGNQVWAKETNTWVNKEVLELVEPTQNFVGGPSNYYDMPYKDWVTTNDQMEYLSKNKWGEYSIHLKDIFKSLCRWGDKDGTTVEYDTRKVIYYGVRVLKMVVGTEQTRKYLQSLLDDKQFKG